MVLRSNNSIFNIRSLKKNHLLYLITTEHKYNYDYIISLIIKTKYNILLIITNYNIKMLNIYYYI